METKTYHTMREQKLAWGDGPWVDEPDKIQWQDPATCLPCLIVRNESGALCGYVGVTEGHPLFGKTYEEADDFASPHGGFTFAGFCQEGAPEALGVCHVPAQGEPDNVYWLGFDCCHYMDVLPSLRRIMVESRRFAWLAAAYRDIGYVRQEVTEVAAAFAKMAQAEGST